MEEKKKPDVEKADVDGFRREHEEKSEEAAQPSKEESVIEGDREKSDAV